MTDNDHNAFVSMHEGMECDNPFDEGLKPPCHYWRSGSTPDAPIQKKFLTD